MGPHSGDAERVFGRAAPLLTASAVGVFALLLLAGVVPNRFVWDDDYVLQQQLPAFRTPADAFFPPAGLEHFSRHYYRPLVLVSYQVDRAVARGLTGPVGAERAWRWTFHATPLLLHALCSSLVVALALALVPRDRAAPRRSELLASAAAGLLFASHPVHVECVAWMAGRSDTLCTAFMLLGILGFLAHARSGRGGRLALALLATAGALLSKEVGAALFALVPIVAVLGPVRPSRRTWIQWAVGGTALAVSAFLLRAIAMADISVRPGVAAFEPAKLLRALGWYAIKLVWPPPQSVYVPDVPEGRLFAAAGLAALACLAWLGWRSLRPATPGARPALVGALWLVLTLAPPLSVVLIQVAITPLAERYLYAPSAGAVLVVAALLVRLSGRRAAAALLLSAFVVLVYSAITVRRERVFDDPAALWEDARAKNEDHPLVWAQYGLALETVGREGAEQALRRAVELARDPATEALVQAALGEMFLRQQQFARAVEPLRRALPGAADPPAVRGNLAVALLHEAASSDDPALRERHAAEATRLLETNYRDNVRDTTTLLYLGMLRIRAGRDQEGRRLLEEVVRRAPSSEDAGIAREQLAAPRP